MRNPRERIRNSRGYKWWILSLVMLGTFMAVMDVTVVNVGLPTIMSVFHIPISTAEWVITAYMITMTLMLPSAGWIADRIGNKRMYILGLVLFTFGSWLCGRAGSDMFLISARALQGFGSGIIQSLGLAIVTREFPPQQRGLALGLWSVAAAASISFGPLIGGYLVDDYSWHLIFDVNVPVGLAAILFAIFIQKEWRGARAGSFDWPGFLCVVCFMPLLIFALARGNSPSNPEGWSSPEVIGCFAVAAAALIVFIVRELRCENPLLNLKLLCSQVQIGSQVRQIVSGIKAHYSAEEMVGKRVMVVTNLKPAKLAGVLSEGMILCAEDADGNLSLMVPEKEMPAGAEIC